MKNLILPFVLLLFVSGCKKRELSSEFELLKGKWSFVEGNQLTGQYGITINFPTTQTLEFQQNGKFINQRGDKSRNGQYFVSQNDWGQIELVIKPIRFNRLYRKCCDPEIVQVLTEDSLVIHIIDGATESVWRYARE